MITGKSCISPFSVLWTDGVLFVTIHWFLLINPQLKLLIDDVIRHEQKEIEFIYAGVDSKISEDAACQNSFNYFEVHSQDLIGFMKEIEYCDSIMLSDRYHDFLNSLVLRQVSSRIIDAVVKRHSHMDRATNVVFVGPPGVLKTTTRTVLYNALRELNVNVPDVSERDIAADLDEAYRDKTVVSYDSYDEKYPDADVLLFESVAKYLDNHDAVDVLVRLAGTLANRQERITRGSGSYQYAQIRTEVSGTSFDIRDSDVLLNTDFVNFESLQEGVFAERVRGSLIAEAVRSTYLMQRFVSSGNTEFLDLFIDKVLEEGNVSSWLRKFRNFASFLLNSKKLYQVYGKDLLSQVYVRPSFSVAEGQEVYYISDVPTELSLADVCGDKVWVAGTVGATETVTVDSLDHHLAEHPVVAPDDLRISGEEHRQLVGLLEKNCLVMAVAESLGMSKTTVAEMFFHGGIRLSDMREETICLEKALFVLIENFSVSNFSQFDSGYSFGLMPMDKSSEVIFSIIHISRMDKETSSNLWHAWVEKLKEPVRTQPTILSGMVESFSARQEDYVGADWRRRRGKDYPVSVEVESFKDEALKYRLYPLREMVFVRGRNFVAVTAIRGLGNIDPVFQPACGGIVYRHDDLDERNVGIAAREARFLSLETDKTSALWNVFLRGAATVIISDGKLKKRDILQIWSRVLAEQGILGWRYIASSELGTTEEDMNVIADTAYSYVLEKIEYPNAEKIVQKRQWQDIDTRLLWETGVVLPSGGYSAKRGGYPPFSWDLSAVGLISGLDVLRWHQKIRALSDVIVDGFGWTGRTITRNLITHMTETMRIVGVSEGDRGVYSKEGLDRVKIIEDIATRDAGKSRTWLSRQKHISKSDLLAGEADILILADRRFSLSDRTLRSIRADIIVEAVPGVLSHSQRDWIEKQGKIYVPSFCVNGGILFGSVREKINHMFGGDDYYRSGDIRLHVESGTDELGASIMFEACERSVSEFQTIKMMAHAMSEVARQI
ncbi:MAG: hypothetical protein PHV68_09805, partial [Candidatus Gastranaerophilales bacterium]|nr:hypothetical protein [Candidatus Gastranaerophilales bacterium]